MDGRYIIDLYIENRYKGNRKRIKQAAASILKQQDIQGPAEVSVAIIGDRKMRHLHKTYKGEDKTTNILSFPLSEGGAMVMSTDILRLGDIVISYPQVIKEASEDE